MAGGLWEMFMRVRGEPQGSQPEFFFGATAIFGPSFVPIYRAQ